MLFKIPLASRILLLPIVMWAAGLQSVSADTITTEEFPTTPGANLHDAVPDGEGRVWYTDRSSVGKLGAINPTTGEIVEVALGEGANPHGVIMGPKGNVWVTDPGLNAIVRVDPETLEKTIYNLPVPNVNLNTAAFDGQGIHWFTGNAGYIGRVDPATGEVKVFKAPRGEGPYGMATAPDGTVYYASLHGGYLGRIDSKDGSVTVLDPPTAKSGVRRVWADSKGNLWVSQYHAGQLARFEPATGKWTEWSLPGEDALPYAIFVDTRDQIWLSDHGWGGGNNTLLHFNPKTETFTTVTSTEALRVAQLGGLPGEVWGADRDRGRVVVMRYEP